MVLGATAAGTFVVVAAIMVLLMPQPLRRTDALVVGTVATMAALAVLFAGFMLSTHQRDVFFKKRTKK